MAFQRGGLKTGESHTIVFAKTTHIHVRVVDPEGNPLKQHAYTLRLPDGKLLKGKLDDDGWAKHEGVRVGDCEFKLVEPDELYGGPDDGTHFVNVVIKDEDGRPLEGEEYTLVMANGKSRKGKLDHEGRALEEKVPAGPCFFALRDFSRQGKSKRHIRLQFMDEDGDPFANLPFKIQVGSDAVEGTTSADGRVIADVPGDGDDGVLTIWVDDEPMAWDIKISQVAS